MPFGFVDLFSGIGGFHAALSALGGTGVLASEIDPWAQKVYERNWGLQPAGDVRELAADPERLVPEHAVLAAGFPCQPFSKSGAQRGMNELRGQMVNEVLKILAVRKPPVVVLENVRNIAGPRQRPVWNAVIQGLREAGYQVSGEPSVFSPHWLPPHLGGSPQSRERVYILATYVGRDAALAATDLRPTVLRGPVDGWDPTKWDLESDVLEPEHTIRERQSYVLSDQERVWIDTWNDFLRRTKEIPLPGHPLWSECWRDEARVDLEAPAWKQAFQTQNILFYRSNHKAIDAWRAANPQIDTFPASRRKLEWQAQDSPRDLRTCLLHLRPSGIRVKKPSYTPTLVAITQTPVVGPRMRRMTVREAARLQGFPDWFSFDEQGSKASYKQLGNAVHLGAAFHVVRQHVLRDADAVVAAGGGALVEAVEAAPLSPVDALGPRGSEV